MKKLKNINPFTDTEQFITGLKKEDTRNLRLTRRFQWIMWAFVLLYGTFFLIIPAKDIILTQRLGGLSDALAFAVFALVFRKLYLDYRSVDYGVSTVEMLKQTIIRYHIFHRKILLIIPPILLVDLGTVLLKYDPAKAENLSSIIVESQILLFSALGVGLIIGYFIWRKRQKPLRDAAKAMLKEIES